jgi:CrcB protein
VTTPPARWGSARAPVTAPMLGVIALGGAVGALLRWALGELVPDGSGFPWTTFAINLSGSAVLAVLPGLVAEGRRPLLALALGPGLLGGFTTLSAYAEQGRRLLADGSGLLAAAYLGGTLVACVAAVHVGAAIVHRRNEPDVVT